jgi:hypothetical protein
MEYTTGMAGVLLTLLVMVVLMLDREQIVSMLRSEVDQATLLQEQRRMEYQNILRKLCHENSSPEDADSLQQACLAEAAARDGAWKSLQRLNDFLEHGVTPKDLPENRVTSAVTC